MMIDLTCLPLHLNISTRICRAVIETPKGSRIKFRYDPQARSFRLGRVLPEGMMFPFDFGFLPSTLGEDGDPLDIMVMLEAPAPMGCLIEVRILGIIVATQTEHGVSRRNDRLLGVAIHSYAHGQLTTVKELSTTLLNQVEEFFVSYNKQRKRIFKIKEVGGPNKAIQFLNVGHRSFKKAQKEKG